MNATEPLPANDADVDVAEQMQRVLYEVKRIVVGQDHFLERVLVAMLAQGHLLVEGVPGLAKTLTVSTLAHANELIHFVDLGQAIQIGRASCRERV